MKIVLGLALMSVAAGLFTLICWIINQPFLCILTSMIWPYGAAMLVIGEYNGIKSKQL